MAAVPFLAVVVIPVLLGCCTRVHVAGGVSFRQIAFYSVRAIAHITGVVQELCGKPPVTPFTTKPLALVSTMGCAQEEWC